MEVGVVVVEVDLLLLFACAGAATKETATPVANKAELIMVDSVVFIAVSSLVFWCLVTWGKTWSLNLAVLNALVLRCY
ncbi:hypothetical protein PL9214640133 [Planktothrix tepida PCC 9214]|uniref:Uncharacterized protein n=1 Tax=Planktothrix tepida PCC 9214 TaxID=671072 RepID=A0A1J1LPG0_9CYAN|nr:hypothetical protein PL9214640133 [Planktothrix tepida PCC 9214]